MTQEHAAWLLLKKRIEYLNTFAGNRSKNESITRMINEAWEGAEVVAKKQDN